MNDVNVLQRVLLACAFVLAGCGGVREQFIGTRIEDQCDGQWNVCTSTVGCMLGDTSYVKGRFPGGIAVGFRLFEPSTVTASFFLSETSGAGTLTTLNFYEAGCSARIRTEVTGKTFFAEEQQAGFVQRSADLSGTGDHLIEVESDSRSNYLMKLDILPLRLKSTQ